MSIRARTWEILEVARPDDKLSRVFDIFILSLIFLNVLAGIVGTIDAVYREYGSFLDAFEVFSVVIFTVEYAGRVWSSGVVPGYVSFSGRIRFLLRPMLLIDLLAVLPFYLPFFGADLRIIRVLRLMRIFRVTKIGRYSRTLGLMQNVMRQKKEELLLTIAMMSMLLILSASAMYYCEHDAQPAGFPSIPATLWWATMTLTTVGYGDVYPVTALGKAVASFISILGIGMFALPTGILGAGFVEEIQRIRGNGQRCPHCGGHLGKADSEGS